MKYRTFDDYLGRRWEVWQTNPADSELRLLERRRGSDRRRAKRADSPERRAETDRRNSAIAGFPAVPQLQGGWLCFEREGQEKERRRLAHIRDNCEKAKDMPR